MKRPETTQEKLDGYEKERLALQKEKSKAMPWLILWPIIIFFATLVLTQSEVIVIPATIIAAIISSFIYKSSIGNDFDGLKSKVRKTLIKEFMTTYHPKTVYNYYPTIQKVREIVKRSKLIRGVDDYDEEDIITGSHNGAYFYFSEIHLQQEDEDSTTTLFKGILFKIKLPNRKFPNSKIQSRRGLFSKIFGNFYHNEEFDVYINSEDPQVLEEEIRPLLPFISHLSKKQGDLRISTHGDEITIMMKSNMQFLDDPKQRVDETFLKEQYRDNVGRQLNTLLFIVDSFINNSDTSEIEERLELKTMMEVRRPNV